MTERKPKIQIKCDCGKFVCWRDGDVLEYHGLRMELKRTQVIEFSCGCRVRVFVDRDRDCDKMRIT